jgi:hypothetical protein
MKSKIFWAAISLAAIAMLISAAPDLRRYAKISMM